MWFMDDPYSQSYNPQSLMFIAQWYTYTWSYAPLHKTRKEKSNLKKFSIGDEEFVHDLG